MLGNFSQSLNETAQWWILIWGIVAIAKSKSKGTMKANFKTTVLARKGANAEKPLVDIIQEVFEQCDLEPRSYVDYEQDMKELASMSQVEVETLTALIPELH